MAAQRALAMSLYGCDAATVDRLNDGLPLRQAGSKARAYHQQRWNAAQRGIGWEITFPEWVALWVESGHWSERGAHQGGYVMARHKDLGPYKLGNVSIETHEKNISDGHSRGVSLKQLRGMQGTGRGWTYKPECTSRPYGVQFRKKWIGSFATEAEATACYQSLVAERLAFLATPTDNRERA